MLSPCQLKVVTEYMWANYWERNSLFCCASSAGPVCLWGRSLPWRWEDPVCWQIPATLPLSAHLLAAGYWESKRVSRKEREGQRSVTIQGSTDMENHKPCANAEEWVVTKTDKPLYNNLIHYRTTLYLPKSLFEFTFHTNASQHRKDRKSVV